MEAVLPEAVLYEEGVGWGRVMGEHQNYFWIEICHLKMFTCDILVTLS